MIGVEILSQEVMYVFSNNINVFLGFFIALSIIGVVLAIVLREAFILFPMLAVGVFAGLLAYYGIETRVGEYTQYKVTISDSVSFKEFTDKYEVLDQDGQIYVVKEKDENIK